MRLRSLGTVLASLALGCLSSIATAGTASSKNPEGAVAPAKDDQSIYDKIWSLANLYHNDDAIIQDISFTGRAQLDYNHLESNVGDNDAWEMRRLRAGLKVKFLDKWLLHGEVDFANQDFEDTSYRRMTDLYLAYTASDAFVFSIGKHSVKFTLDGGTSSKELIAIDRSNLANNLWFSEEYAPGVSIAGKVKNWQYFLGWFTSDGNPEFGNFDAGSFLLASVGYDFAENLHAKKAVLRLDYVHQTPDEGNEATRPFENIGSLNFNYEKGRFGLGTDFSAGQGYGAQGDVFGLMVMPSWHVTKDVQLVFRYTHMNGDDNSIRFARYESHVLSGKGDEYNEFYAGVNWYLYGHKLKFQSGIQYATMDDSKKDGGDYDGWSLVSGIRVSW